MAKTKQTLIPGTVDEPTPEVAAAVTKYLDPKRKIAGLREKMNAGKDELVDAMKAAGLSEILIDDGEKKLILRAKDQIEIKARKKSEAAED